MSEAASRLSEQARELRLAFDRGFAEQRSGDVTPMDDLLAFRVGHEPYAFRLSEIAGLFADRKITPLPTAAPALLGLASVRGVMAPVYDLHVILGRPAVEAPRWLALLLGAPAALAFEVFDGHLRIPRDAITSPDAGDRSSRLIREFVAAAGLVRPVVHLPSVLEAISERAPQPHSTRKP